MKRIILAIITLLSLNLATPLLAGSAYAACAPDGSPKGQVIDGIQTSGGDCSTGGVDHIIATIVNVMSIIVGAAAVIMVIVSGFKYITAGGDSGKISSAKTTLIYALVGLAIAALAQFLVNYVFTQATTAASATCNSGYHPSTADTTKCVKD